jgi:hypothetical protein
MDAAYRDKEVVGVFITFFVRRFISRVASVLHKV